MATQKRTGAGRKVLLPVLIILLLIGGYLAFEGYKRWLMPNTVKTGKLFIPTNATYTQVLDSLKPFLKDVTTFNWLARQKKYDNRIKPGRYSIGKNENNSTLINRLRSGAQDEISIRIGNYSSIYELAGKMGSLLEPDSASIVEAIVSADFAQGHDTAALVAFFFPNTYNFHWNTSGKAFVMRMKTQYDKYWTGARIQDAMDKKMTPLEVSTLASIVQLESSKTDEQPRVAGLYLNRLNIGMKLDADPTVIYAMRKAAGFKQKIQRVYNKNLEIVSPYNTYKNKGLPPGPICMPNQSALDAVLHPAEHKYLYFVADPSRPGYHLYATTLEEQEKNATIYREWLNRNNVR